MKKSVLLLFFAGCVAIGIFGIGRKIPMNRVNDLGQREGYWRDSLGEGITHELYYKGGKKDGLFKCFIRNELFLFGNTQRIICPAHGMYLEMKGSWSILSIR